MTLVIIFSKQSAIMGNEKKIFRKDGTHFECVLKLNIKKTTTTNLKG